MKTQLQTIRKRAGYKSAKDFAEHAGMSVNTYTGHEQGKPYDLEKAWEYADLLDCSLDELVGRPRPKKEFSDPRQEEMNRDYASLDEFSKEAAAAAVRGMAAACAQAIDPKGSEVDKRTA